MSFDPENPPSHSGNVPSRSGWTARYGDRRHPYSDAVRIFLGISPSGKKLLYRVVSDGTVLKPSAHQNGSCWQCKKPTFETGLLLTDKCGHLRCLECIKTAACSVCGPVIYEFMVGDCSVCRLEYSVERVNMRRHLCGHNMCNWCIANFDSCFVCSRQVMELKPQMERLAIPKSPPKTVTIERQLADLKESVLVGFKLK